MKVIAGEVITLEVDGVRLTAKIEDASKGDIILAKVESVVAKDSRYQAGQVYEFDRKAIAQ